MHSTTLHATHRQRRQVIWGLTLVVFGVAYLLQRDDDAAVARLWQYWPWVLVAFGANSMLPPTDGRRFVDGLSQVLFGAWFWVTWEGWWGLTFSNSWPLLIIVAGLGMALQPLANRYFPRRHEEQS
ncbi:LiaF transmembrane domain-containing protein [Pseudoduganella armeniaca]|uniref:LiaF transmembrane domain-containing protein n=1 Tax=Pseudoduganella armeniaca TaxID=2072590 RepID=A0A2R4C9X2_9BURK|nr:hypothetical protein [Pseudoduganella armeniaca]AVR96391.1 hypothetical protein C9I28_12260 [Pseudoduganella armeniaca]